MTRANAYGEVAGQPASERPTLIEGLRPRQPLSREPTASDRARIKARPCLSARCTVCGARASDWRQMLGLGAHLLECAGDAARVRLEYPHACGTCGASEVLVVAA